MFKATELQQIRKFDILQTPLFSTLASSRNLVLKVFPSAARQYL